MTARFADVLEVSLTMAVVLAVLLALRPLLKKRLRARAFYWVWLLAALRLCIPFNVSLPQAPVTVEAAPRQALVRVDTHRTNPGGTEYRVMTPLEAEQAQSAAYSAPREPDAPSAADRYTTVLTAGQLLALLWLAGAGVFLAWHLAKYVRFRLRVRRWGAPAEDTALLARFEEAKAELGVNNLALLICPAVGAPLVTGFVNPVLLLPREAVSDGVLRHELIHTRRRDLWYKLLLLLARALHWFNPLVHGMARAANRDLERACDEEAVAGRDAAFRAAYGAAMLDAVEEGIEARAPPDHPLPGRQGGHEGAAAVHRLGREAEKGSGPGLRRRPGDLRRARRLLPETGGGTRPAQRHLRPGGLHPPGRGGVCGGR